MVDRIRMLSKELDYMRFTVAGITIRKMKSPMLQSIKTGIELYSWRSIHFCEWAGELQISKILFRSNREDSCFVSQFQSISYMWQQLDSFEVPLRVARSKWTKNPKSFAKNAKSLQKMPNKLKQVECCWFWHIQVNNLAKTQQYSWTRH